MSPRILSGLLAAFVLLATGCKDPDGATGGTTGAALYAYDSATSTVFVFSDVGSVYDGTATSIAPTKQITSSVFSSKISSLAWGGLCLDAQHAYLYLVSDSGNIVRVSNLRSQSGTVNSAEVVSFSLANTGRLSGSTFGQAALDPSTDALYITENSGSGTQIWVVANASSQPQDASVALQALQVSGDSGGTGVAAGSGSVYGFMLDGSTVGTVVTYSGPRLRKGTASAFTDANTLIGSSTLLGKYGSLALDTSGKLFVARHNTDAGATTAPIQVFTTGLFGQAYNQPPTYTLGDPTAQADLRVLAHAGTKDWLVGLRGNGSTAYGTIFIWKSPLGGTAAKAITVTPTGSLFKGVAVDGNAS
ncbi:MAG: hypothetical protein IPN91_15160 [Holophagaceae bacterium]|uniref:Uncharacterized protein n=1 Tax=Candidatus Geothrix odensensis TaxID=2954440 RepID=A0A936K884_9BACT|nr:hypothetical protein [Candidatus Geothrix odensensis]